MNENKKYFISTTLPYLNSKPHIGHCFEFVIADIIARFRINQGNKVIFNVGVDEHGTKIAQAAKKENLNIQKYCDKYAHIWKQFCKQFQIDYTNFYRTSDTEHKIKARRYFEYFNCDEYFYTIGVKPNFLFEKEYEGYYCEGCEAFKTEKEIEDEKCLIHQQKVKLLKEKNIFFNLHHPSLKEKIKDILIDKTLSKELEKNIEELKEISITRRNVAWGVKFDDEQTLYVWAEALCNYCFAAGYDVLSDSRYEKEWQEFKEYWANSLIICGKDNLKFQAYILQALLLAQDLPQTKEVLVHGTILDQDGIKMSKTLGNVIDPIEQLEKFGVSPVRYYLFLGLNTFNDSSYSELSLINLWNADIVNGYGNLLSRVIHLIDIKNVKTGYCSQDWFFQVFHIKEELNSLFAQYKFQEFKEVLNNFVTLLNKRINDEKPYSNICENSEIILNELYYACKQISEYYKIILPEYEEALNNLFKDKKKKIIFPRLEIKEVKVNKNYEKLNN